VNSNTYCTATAISRERGDIKS